MTQLGSMTRGAGAFIIFGISLGPIVTMAQSLPAPSKASADTSRGTPSDVHDSTSLQEIVVTAQKRTEDLKDVPVGITVVSADSLLRNNETSLQDFYASVPGLSINDAGTGGRVNISMRGVSTGTLNPTVGITVDDVPIGQTVTADINSATYVPQFDPADLQQIEVLKGPQGTLYGASSIGGVLRYVTIAPDLTSTSGRVEADGNSIAPDGASGYSVRGSINLPLIPDAFAIRASAFDRQDPGFVNDPAHDEQNVNTTDTYGGRVDALWQVTPTFSARLGGFIQRAEGNDGTIDTNYLYQPIEAGLSQYRLPGSGGYLQENQVYSATLNLHTRFCDVTSISSYSQFKDDEYYDQIGVLGDLAEQFFGVQGAEAYIAISSHKVTQEVRLTSSGNSKVEWLVGGFYTGEYVTSNDVQAYANNLQTGAVVAPMLNASSPSTYHEVAAFADVTYHFTDQFNIQLGGREGHNWQHYSEDLSGVLEGPAFSFNQTSADNSFTYLVTPQLKLSDSEMVYLRVASGYQPGGPNTPGGPGADIAPVYRPSTTVNYELGLKSRLLDRRLSIDTDIYLIDWKQIQIQENNAEGLPYIVNGGKARSEGFELAVDFKLIEALTLSGTASYTDAKLTNNAGNGFTGVSGDPLPYSSKYSGSLSADYKINVSGSVQGFANVTAAYVGKRYLTFPTSIGQIEPSVPSYAYGNAHLGVIKNGYTVTAYAKNITNERGILSSIPANYTSYTMSGVWHTSVITPRTVGISISKAF